MGIGRLGSVTLECDDVRALAAFWAAVLAGEVHARDDALAAARCDGLWITAVRTPGHTPDGGPVRRHLDVAVDDLDSAEARALELGATRADAQPAPQVFRVLRDPAGHPFCLTTAIPA